MPARRFALASIAALFFASQALAHPGAHEAMSLTEALWHLAEPDHLAFLAVGAVVACALYCALRTGAFARAFARLKGGKP